MQDNQIKLDTLESSEIIEALQQTPEAKKFPESPHIFLQSQAIQDDQALPKALDTQEQTLSQKPLLSQEPPENPEIPELPQKRNRSPSPESSPEDEPGTYFLISGVTTPYLIVNQSFLLLDINRHIPRVESRELQIFFLKRHPSKVYELRDQLHRNCLISEHPRASALSDAELCSRLNQIMQSIETLKSTIKPQHGDKKERNFKKNANMEREEALNSEVDQMKNERLMDRLKQKAHELLGENYKNFSRAFAKLVRDRQSRKRFIEDDANGMFSIQVFYIIWFILTELSIRTLKKYYKILCEMNIESLQNFFETHSTVHPVLKCKSISLLFLGLYAQDPEPEPYLCVREAFSSYKGGKIYRLNNQFPKPTSKFLKILVQKRFKSYFASKVTKYRRFMIEVIDNTYITSLPQGVDSLMLFNRKFIISTTDRMEALNNGGSVFWGFTLISLIRQTLIYIFKKRVATDKDWLEYVVPEETVKKERKGLEKALFGRSIDYISKSGASFLLKPKKWEMTAPAFIKGFSRSNKFKRKLMAEETNKSLLWFSGGSGWQNKYLRDKNAPNANEVKQSANDSNQKVEN
ncbi:hypothetical protein SteCoe_23759 [Stentor coeruleus]|uniref:Uncharacterized protein n=1 Tax=Stentor coeruleus TaxID=5963 RepID=A0A1R2BJ42_9CILI|nr:hypothetical protein SteCoe_23759 [Stentor coeruleus]